MQQENNIEIKLLEFPECCRMRPGMYIGGVEDPSVIFREIIDNFMDESYACEYCNKGYISQNFGGFHLVADNGRGLPITMSKDKPEITQAELAIGSLHAGSKFVTTGTNRVGTNGVGSSVCNALSERYIILSVITKDNYNKSIPEVEDLWNSKGPRSKKNLYYYLEYNKGIKVKESAGELRVISEYLFGVESNLLLPEEYSTYVLFIPDKTIFDSVKTKLPSKNLQYFMLIQEKFNKKMVDVLVNGERIKEDFKPYQFEVIRTIKPNDDKYNKEVKLYMTFEVDKNLGSRETYGSINSLVVPQGHHIQIAEACYREAIMKSYNLTHNYIFNGLKLFVIVLAEELMFDSQTKERCKSIKGVKSSDFGDLVKDIIKVFKSEPEYWGLHIDRLNAYAESMTNLSTMDKIKKLVGNIDGEITAKSRSLIPKKVVDASAPTNERRLCELFIVEGDSAAGGLVKTRDRRYSGILPLRGRPKQTVGLDLETAIQNQEVCDLISTIGMGVSQKYNINKLRYGKVIIATDADDDGQVISATIIGTILTHLSFLIPEGMLYIAESPIYIQGGKYIYPSDKQLDGTYKGLNMSKPYNHIKGLGELDPPDIKKVFFDKSTRRLIQVTPENIEKALDILSTTDAKKNIMIKNNLLINPYNLK